MKPNPYYRSEKEREELLKKRDSFKFDEPVETPRLVVLLAGKEGSGKTHLACTMSALGPVYLIDTEYRAQIVTRKFPGVRFTTAKNFMELAVAVKYIVKDEAPRTIVVDSGSDLQTFAEIEYLERTEKEKVGMPWNWAEVWRLCNAIIDDVKCPQKFNLVVTARLKEEYMNDKGTGKYVPRIYSTLPYKADLVLQFTGDAERHLLVTKNGFSGEVGRIVSASETLPQLIARLSESAPAAVPAQPRQMQLDKLAVNSTNHQ